ncbi:MAG: DAK2 domain-containing protein [Ruminococcus sp.]|nr:DAK2 domain-containing protein [Ruminococcus sp.]MCM1380558.1 DAK2 domain-containing protein [Muribaculaceae bacterium]MCM1478937.1 DAK2 domain-containing protein [Muribaculaceae bacterium]
MITGKILRDAFISGAVAIANKKSEVDRLNVYPVPDGDTGTNMSMTMSNALRELRVMEDGVTAERVSDAVAAALLRGARGNSGVILSLIFRGFAKAFKGKNDVSANDFKKALELGVEGAYKAVMSPTEGTILTVARLASEKAKNVSTEDIAELWREVCAEAKTALDNTPNLLPVLKKAGVVDAGGMGLYVIWTAMLEVFEGGEPVKPLDVPKTETVVTAADPTVVGDFDEEITHTYCTEFIVRKAAGCKDAAALRAFLETIGDCVVAVDDDDIIKVHVHTEHPGQAIEEGLLFGSLINLKIDNMRYQHENKAKEAAAAKKRDGNFTPAAPEKPFGFVAVASGAGIEELFRNLGADCIVRGGQTMNPSTDDILQAVMAVPAETVFVLPNNKNIIMAAEQAVKLADRKVCVLQSRTVPQGITAMMNFDPSGDFDTNRLNMTKSLDNVATGLVTFAARDSDFEGHSIKQGEILALADGKLSFTEKDVSKAAYKLTKKLMSGSSAYITLIYGADVSEEKAREVYTRIREKFDNAEVMLINGGQPVYYYIISVE